MNKLNSQALANISLDEIEKYVESNRETEELIYNSQMLKASVLKELSRTYEEQAGIQTMFWPKFNEMIGGLREGELTVVFADTGIGKTTFAMNWCSDLVQGGHPCMYISLENPTKQVAKSVMKMITGIYIPMPAKPEHLAAVGKSFDLYGENLYFYDETFKANELNLLKAIYFAKKNYGVKAIYLDHFDRLEITRKSNESKVDCDTRFLNSFHMFLQRIGVACVGIVHVAKAGDKGGYNKQKNRGERQVMLDEIKGSSAYKQVPDMVLGINRPDIDSNVTKVKLEKIRQEGFGKINESVLFTMGAGLRFKEESGV